MLDSRNHVIATSRPVDARGALERRGASPAPEPASDGPLRPERARRARRTGSRLRPLGVALLLASCAGCAKKPDPNQYRYAASFGEGSRVPLNGKLYLGDRPLGPISVPERPVAYFALPAATLLHGQKDQLAVRVETPCGPRSVAVEIVEDFPPEHFASLASHEALARKERSPSSIIGFKARVDESKLPVETAFWVDFGEPARKVSIGKLPLRPSDRDGDELAPILVPGLDCAAEHEVEVDGKPVGKVSSTSLLAAIGGEAVEIAGENEAADKKRKRDVEAMGEHARKVGTCFFIGAPGACYRWTNVVYTSSADVPSLPVRLRGRQLYRLPEWLDYPLRPAPSSISGVAIDSRTELVAVECRP